ncbi:lanthionine synthetase C family protein [Streptomyces sp. SCA3-4]|uniref:lanthionine synthetase C family protein n=1 Tax=Streptomyces sichuanensis TaxID=2871810 RepID=UPI001CE2E946|nr:lanthionine synthetase C family protein [Streptomyces sichuanensis]MCA6093783.1 lanthionine synthetase C family protein [Streptomyces sichuanensis]
MAGSTWTAAVSGGAADAALGLVEALAGRPRATPSCVRPDLAGGGPGLALVYDQLDRHRPGEGWGAMADGYLAASARGTERLRTTAPGLHAGLAGPAFAAWCLSAARPPDARTEDATQRRAAALAGGTHGVAWRDVDVIHGLAGTGALLLCRAGESPDAERSLRAVLTALVTLCGEHAGVPHWFTPATAIRDDALRERFPQGALNWGAAHGIAGPLALMALAWSAGVRVPGQDEALRRTAGRLLACRTEGPRGPEWPGVTGLDGTPDPRPRSTVAWCYGTPGVARALWLAGTALDDASLRDTAVRAVKAVHRRAAGQHGAGTSPGLCHGLAGLLQITLRFAHDTGEAEFRNAATALTLRLARFRDHGGNLTQDGPGFLDGAAGVLLALLAATTDNAPAWDRALLLA